MRNTHNNNYESTTPCVTDWSSINWNKVNKYVSKLQKRIFRAEREGDCAFTSWIKVCSSCMSRKGHVQFQGECGGVILQSYPARGINPPDLSNYSYKNYQLVISKYKIVPFIFSKR